LHDWDWLNQLLSGPLLEGFLAVLLQWCDHPVAAKSHVSCKVLVQF